MKRSVFLSCILFLSVSCASLVTREQPVLESFPTEIDIPGWEISEPPSLYKDEKLTSAADYPVYLSYQMKSLSAA
ncbi:MAG: hypothetical protein ACRCUT_04080, partial [Spirochaetota bacterium]